MYSASVKSNILTPTVGMALVARPNRWQFLDLLERAEAGLLPVVPIRLPRGVTVGNPNRHVCRLFNRAQTLERRLALPHRTDAVGHTRDLLVRVTIELQAVQDQI